MLKPLTTFKVRCYNRLFADPQRCVWVVRLYNEFFHRLRPSLFHGRHLDFRRTSRAFALKPYQQDAVWRTMNGEGVLCHTPGAGKSQLMTSYNPTPLRSMETVTVRKNDQTFTIALVEIPRGRWRIYRWINQQCANWSLTVGRWFASPLDALRFLREQGYSFDDARQFAGDPKPECHRHDAEAPVAPSTYRFRAECEHDLNELRSVLGTRLKRITMTISPPFPDVEAEVEIDLCLEALRDVMRQVVDGHVMVQTLARSEEYTGIRDYEL